MSVDNGQAVLVVLRGNLSGWVGAEGADLVIKGGGVVYQLGFIQVLIEELHDLVPYLNADADVHGPYLGFNAMVTADVGEPVGAFASDGSYNLRRVIGLILIRDDAFHRVALDDDILYHGVEFHDDALGQKVFLETGVNLVTLLCSQMADGAFDEL